MNNRVNGVVASLLWLPLLANAPAHALDPPVVQMVRESSNPPIPEGWKKVCPGGTYSTPGPTCPVLKYNGYTYWAWSDVNNWDKMSIAAYDSGGNLVDQWDREGARYIERINVNANKTVDFVGQSGRTITLTWRELLLPPGAVRETGYRPAAGEARFATQSLEYFEEIQEAAAKAGKARCVEGATAQSPLNLVTSAVRPDSNLGQPAFKYVKYPNMNDKLVPGRPGTIGAEEGTPILLLDMVNNGHTVDIVTERDQYRQPAAQAARYPLFSPGYSYMINPPPTQEIFVDGRMQRPFELLGIHFHHPSEHLIDGRRYAMEMHMVHKSHLLDSRGINRAVLAVLLDIGEENVAMREMFYSMRAVQPGSIYYPKTQIRQAEIDLDRLLPQNRSHIRYDGSLTTPPCTNDVAWHVFTTPVKVSAQQVLDFRSAVSFNARPRQNEHNSNPLRSPGK